MDVHAMEDAVKQACSQTNIARSMLCYSCSEAQTFLNVCASTPQMSVWNMHGRVSQRPLVQSWLSSMMHAMLCGAHTQARTTVMIAYLTSVQLNYSMEKITERMTAALETAESSMALPATSGRSDSADARSAPNGTHTSSAQDAMSSNVHACASALQASGVVADFGGIRSKGVAIVGCGAVGAAVADMLARSGAPPATLF